MRKHVKYGWYVLRHRWFVFLECAKRGLWWRGLVHDLSKLLPSEWFPYARYFYGPKPECDENGTVWLTEADEARTAAFDLAWMKHQRRNDHHWQAWVLREDSPQEWVIQAVQPELGPFHLGITDGHLEIPIPPVPGDNRIGTIAYDYAKSVRDLLNTHAVFAPKCLPMSPVARTEMVCDWIGAGLAITGKRDVQGWYAKNKAKMQLHPNTRAWIEDDLLARATETS